jgi:hypothetical protein
MPHPDTLDLFNECLSIAEQTTDDKTAERVFLIAYRLLQTAEEEVALAAPQNSGSCVASTTTSLAGKYVRRAQIKHGAVVSTRSA